PRKHIHSMRLSVPLNRADGLEAGAIAIGAVERRWIAGGSVMAALRQVNPKERRTVMLHAEGRANRAQRLVLRLSVEGKDAVQADFCDAGGAGGDRRAHFARVRPGGVPLGTTAMRKPGSAPNGAALFIRQTPFGAIPA